MLLYKNSPNQSLCTIFLWSSQLHFMVVVSGLGYNTELDTHQFLNFSSVLFTISVFCQLDQSENVGNVQFCKSSEPLC